MKFVIVCSWTSHKLSVYSVQLLSLSTRFGSSFTAARVAAVCVGFLRSAARLFPIFDFYEKLLLCVFLTLPPGSLVHTFLLVTHLQVQLSARRVSIFLTALSRYVLGYAYLERDSQTPSQSCTALHRHRPRVSSSGSTSSPTLVVVRLPSFLPPFRLFLPPSLFSYLPAWTFISYQPSQEILRPSEGGLNTWCAWKSPGEL